MIIGFTFILFVSAIQVLEHECSSHGAQWRCQRKIGCGGQGGFVASGYNQTEPIYILQNQSRDHPPDGDDVRQVSTLAS